MVLPKEIVKLIENSGNNFHSKVARWLSDNNWHVIVSPYYMDQTQNKAREIDLIAEKIWPIINHGSESGYHVAVRLFIECKFVPSYSVFWFAEKDQESALNLVCNKIFRPDNMYTKMHHYLASSEKVAKIFSTNPAKAIENDPFYKALNQALNAMVSMSGRPVSVPELKEFRSGPKAVLEFPVIVCSSFDKIYSTDFYKDVTPQKIDNNFQLEVRYAYVDKQGKQKDDYFLLDFVEFDNIDQFIQSIEADVGASMVFLT